MQAIATGLRDLDLFAVPVGLTYRGRRKFGTFIGGFFSLFLILSFTGYAIYTLHQLIVNPTLKNNTERLYVSNSQNSELYNITTE